MDKHFNTAGPSEADLHYLIDPLSRVDFAEIESLIEQRRYFVLHAPRQTGKTTCLLALRDHLNAQGRYAALYLNVETGQAARNDVAADLRSIGNQLAEKSAEPPPDLRNELLHLIRNVEGGDLLRSMLRALAQASPKPVVLFLDEVDALVGDTLISVLRQIRAGYTDRPSHFPQTIVLCGVRDVRDYPAGWRGHHRRLSLQHQGREHPARGLLPGGSGSAVRPAHRRHGSALHARSD
jgi:hypothetical protein